MGKPAPTREPRMPASLANQLMSVAVCAVPFQQALTVPVGFPLKISEISGLLAVILYVIEGRRGAHRYSGAAFQWALLALAALSTVVWLIAGPPSESALGYERGMNADMVLYLAYALVVIVIAWFAGTRLGPEWIGRGLGIAVRLAAIWAALQGALYLAGVPHALSAFGGVQQIGTTYGFGLTRNGPFLEGNYLALFAGVALFVAWRRRDRWSVVAAVFCLLYSQSTTALVGVLIGLLVVAVLRPSGRVTAVLAFLGLAVLLVLTFFDTAALYVSRQLAKLGIITDHDFGASIDYSLRNRTATIQRGLEMSDDFPWMGVGPGRFGYWDDFYSLSSVYGGRGIANNAYVQVLSEVGVPALLCFVILLLILFVRSVRGPRSILAMSAFLIVALNAAPSWTVLPVWFAVAYLATATVRPRRSRDVEIEPELREKQLA